MKHHIAKKHAPEVIMLHGVVSSGTGEAKLFTGLPWVKKQFADKLGIDAVPGTLNIMVVPEDREKLILLKNTKGIEIVPDTVNYCAANGFKALVNGKVPGAIIIPIVPHYPEAQLEIISAEHIKQRLHLKDGDLVAVEIPLSTISLPQAGFQKSN